MIYLWPNIDTDTVTQAPTSNGSFSPLTHEAKLTSETQTPPGMTDGFEDMNAAFETRNPQSTHTGDGLSLLKMTQALAVVEAERTELMQASEEAARRHGLEIEKLTNELHAQQHALNNYKAMADQVSKDLIGMLLAELAQAHIRIDADAWRQALNILKNALAPHPCVSISCAFEPPLGALDPEDSLTLSASIPKDEIHATDGSRVVLLSLQDLSTAIFQTLTSTPNDVLE